MCENFPLIKCFLLCYILPLSENFIFKHKSIQNGPYRHTLKEVEEMDEINGISETFCIFALIGKMF